MTADRELKAEITLAAPPEKVWAAPVPGVPRKTIRMLAGHLHNSRCMWLKTLGRPQGIPVPAAVDRRNVGRRFKPASLDYFPLAFLALLKLISSAMRAA